MIVAVASGKGGTGKSTITAALAEVAAQERAGAVRALDCDVEAPDLALQLHPSWNEEWAAVAAVPSVDPARCDGCGACADACVFSALAVAGGRVLVFEDLCHGCGACIPVCPNGAVRESVRETGTLRAGRADGIQVGEGRLAVGEHLATPVLRQLLDWQLPKARDDDLVLLDGPPGAACAASATLARADRALLVTEPTPFGLHDLTRIVGLARGVHGLPVDVVVNRDDGRDDRVAAYCRAERIPVVSRLPDDGRVAGAASRGEGLLAAVPALRPRILELLRHVRERESP